MKNKKICRHCRKEIDLNHDKLVLLGTYEEKSPLDESYFHFDCFVEWFNEKKKGERKPTTEQRKPSMETQGLGFFGSIEGDQDPMGVLSDIQDMAGGLLKGLDIGVVDVKKDAENMTKAIKKTALGLSKIVPKKTLKKDGKKKKETIKKTRKK